LDEPEAGRCDLLFATAMRALRDDFVALLAARLLLEYWEGVRSPDQRLFSFGRFLRPA
jgi:hypothetical protein